jgi:hypothetical protein
MWFAIAIVAVLVLMTGAAGAIAGQRSPEGIVASKMSYQGKLTDTSGKPLNGTYQMIFRIHEGPASTSTYFWDSGLMNVEVNKGLFRVELPADHDIFNGRELWLRIRVDGDWLTPLQELVPVPYALSLRPGAEIEGNTQAGWGVQVNWTHASATGGALYGQSATSVGVLGRSPGGYGVWGYSDDNYAVYGYDAGTDIAHGYGGYFASDNGIGVYGYSDATSYYTNMYTPGVYGRSANGVGVYGVTEGSGWKAYGVFGEGQNGDGVRGYSESASGVVGDSRYHIGVTGTSSETLSIPVVGTQRYLSSGDLPSKFWRPGGLFYNRNGVIGMTKEEWGYGTVGYNMSTTNGWAGWFESANADGVHITTPAGRTGLSVAGGTKSAVVPTTEGDRYLYSEESTEVWFSDYGFGQLEEGTAFVPIDPLFAQTVNLELPYHVFVQVYGEADVFVGNRTAEGFDVWIRDGDLFAEFSYRIVAKRLGYEEFRMHPAPWEATRGGSQRQQEEPEGQP